MRELYEAKCPVCGELVVCAEHDLMGFPQAEFGDQDPMIAVCDECGAVLRVKWSVTLTDAGNAKQTPIHGAQEDMA